MAAGGVIVLGLVASMTCLLNATESMDVLGLLVVHVVVDLVIGAVPPSCSATVFGNVEGCLVLNSFRPDMLTGTILAEA